MKPILLVLAVLDSIHLCAQDQSPTKLPRVILDADIPSLVVSGSVGLLGTPSHFTYDPTADVITTTREPVVERTATGWKITFKP